MPPGDKEVMVGQRFASQYGDRYGLWPNPDDLLSRYDFDPATVIITATAICTGRSAHHGGRAGDQRPAALVSGPQRAADQGQRDLRRVELRSS